MASRKNPMAQRGSVCVMAVNSLAARAYQNEWRTATAWSNARWVSAPHEVARGTVPTSSAETGDPSATTKTNTNATSVDIAEASLVWEGEWRSREGKDGPLP